MNKGLKIATVIVGIALTGFVGYRVYKWYQFRSGNPTKDKRKIKINSNS